MNFVARHYFDFQSLMNLPHNAIQLHKTPPSQAGCDPTAAWAPKSMHVAGKNQPAPAARANHSNVDTRPGSHRHGRPSKLEFRNWGERHGELRADKTIPHDAWMESLYGGHLKDIKEGVRDEDSMADYFIEESKDQTGCSILVILTATQHLNLITLTVKMKRGLIPGINPFVKVRFFDQKSLIEERFSEAYFSGHNLAKRTSLALSLRQQKIVEDAEFSADWNAGTPSEDDYLEMGDSFLFSVSPSRLPFCHVEISLYSRLPVNQETLKRIDLNEQRKKDLLKEISPKKMAFVGRLVGSCSVGPHGSGSRGNMHWKRMIRKPGVPTCMWHSLRKPRVQCRSLSVSSSPAKQSLGATTSEQKISDILINPLYI